ncbi:MAG: hypothetical protein QOF94_2487, partial [Acidobacteriaceae bacterium]
SKPGNSTAAEADQFGETSARLEAVPFPVSGLFLNELRPAVAFTGSGGPFLGDINDIRREVPHGMSAGAVL